MRRDLRLSSILSWDRATTADEALQLIGQLALAVDTASGEAVRKQAFRRMLDARELLDEDARARLAASAVRAGLEDAAERFLATPESREISAGVLSAPRGLHLAVADLASGHRDVEYPQPVEDREDQPGSIKAMNSRLQELVSRIERFRSVHSEQEPVPAPADSFQWSTDEFGTIAETGDPSRLPKGARLAELPFEGAVAALIAQQLPFRDARVALGGRVVALSGTPRFEADSGRFGGYDGDVTYRRETEGLDIPDGSVAEFSHEILTPLNAILGYSQMIDQEIMGPAPAQVREEAGSLMKDAGELISVVESLGEAATLHRNASSAASGPVSGAEELRTIEDEVKRALASRGVASSFEITGEPLYLAEEDRFRRQLRRLMLAVAAKVEPDETFRVVCTDSDLSIELPSRLASVDPAILFDQSTRQGPPREFALLGLSFALRMIRETVERDGGSVRLEGGTIVLHPYADAGAARQSYS